MSYPVAAARGKIRRGSAQVAYTLYDAFTTDRAAGAINGTPSESPYATGGGVTREVVDTGSDAVITSGKFQMQATASNLTDPTLAFSTAFTRTLGTILIADFQYVSGDISGDRTAWGWWTTKTTNSRNEWFELFSTGLRPLTVQPPVTSGTGENTLAIILRATGAWFFVKSSGTWHLVWVSRTNSNTPLYVRTANQGTVVSNWDNVRVPVATYIPTPLVYDTFTRANGALGSTETTGPDSQTVSAKIWLFTSGVWAVSSNAAVGTPNVGADVIVNGGFDSDTVWNKGAGWAIGSGVATITASGNSIAQTAGAMQVWYRSTFTITAYTSGSLKAQFGFPSSDGQSRSATGTFTDCKRLVSTSIGIIPGGATTAEIDNVSFVPLTTADLFSSFSVSTPNVIADVGVTATSLGRTQAGLVLNLDSDTAPANFVIAYLDRTSSGDLVVRLEKCVAGTYASVIAAAATYSAGAQLRVIKSGTSYSLYYNGALVGSTSTISDAGIVSNTLHGLFSTSELNSLDGFTLWARGVGGEYATLDDY